MQSAEYYLSQAQKAEYLSSRLTDEQASAALLKIAEDYRDIAKDLENGAIDIQHPERLPQLGRER